MDYIVLVFATGGFLILEHFALRFLKRRKLFNATVVRALLGFDYIVCGVSSAVWSIFSMCIVFLDHMMPDMLMTGAVVVSVGFIFLRTELTKRLNKQ